MKGYDYAMFIVQFAFFLETKVNKMKIKSSEFAIQPDAHLVLCVSHLVWPKIKIESTKKERKEKHVPNAKQKLFDSNAEYYVRFSKILPTSSFLVITQYIRVDDKKITKKNMNKKS